jgi:hypothetical protein
MARVYSTSFWQGALFDIDFGVFDAYAYAPGFLAVIRDIDVAYTGMPGASFSLGPGASVWPIQSPLLFDGSTWQWQGRFVIQGPNDIWIGAFAPTTVDTSMHIQVSGFLLSLP